VFWVICLLSRADGLARDTWDRFTAKPVLSGSFPGFLGAAAIMDVLSLRSAGVPVDLPAAASLCLGVKPTHVSARRLSRRAALKSALAAAVLPPASSVPHRPPDAPSLILAPLLVMLDAAMKQWQTAMNRVARAEADGDTGAAETAEAAAAAEAEALCLQIATVPSQTFADIASKLLLVWQLQTGRSRGPGIDADAAEHLLWSVLHDAQRLAGNAGHAL
jgi:hypothetical protein